MPQNRLQDPGLTARKGYPKGLKAGKTRHKLAAITEEKTGILRKKIRDWARKTLEISVNYKDSRKKEQRKSFFLDRSKWVDFHQDETPAAKAAESLKKICSEIGTVLTNLSHRYGKDMTSQVKENETTQIAGVEIIKTGCAGPLPS